VTWLSSSPVSRRLPAAPRFGPVFRLVWPGWKPHGVRVIIDDTHHPSLALWVESANAHAAFTVQNLPLDVFSPKEGGGRGGIRVGEKIFDVWAALETGVFPGAAPGGSATGERRFTPWNTLA
jgi:hypothetical protein